LEFQKLIKEPQAVSRSAYTYVLVLYSEEVIRRKTLEFEYYGIDERSMVLPDYCGGPWQLFRRDVTMHSNATRECHRLSSN
jgi:hypothetical protein